MLREKMVGMHCSYARLQMDVRELEDPWFYYEMVLTRFLLQRYVVFMKTTVDWRFLRTCNFDP